MNRTDVQDTLREMWETRPARPREGRQVAGVAVAIARRYDIDPVLVRVGFVVAGFYGIGLALYVAGWILLPESTADDGAPRPDAPRPLVLVGLAVLGLISLGSIFGGHNGVVLPTLAALGLLFLLHRSRGDRSPAAAPSAAAAPSLVKDTPSDPDGATRGTPPAWDPLGAAPFAWDLPEPSPAPPPVPPRRRPVTSVTLALALLASGVTALAMLAAGALSPATLPVLFGVVLSVLGLGLVVGAFLRAGRGLIPFALLFSALTWAVVAGPVHRWPGEGVGELRDAPTTVAALAPRYARTAGEVDLDLRGLDLTVPAGASSSPAPSTISVGVGNVQIEVPRDADLTLHASAGVGRVAYGDQESRGPDAAITVTENLGADGIRSGRLLVLDVEAGAGNVEVRRG